MIAMARALGIATLAEGVEYAEAAAVLRRLGCDHFQGYHVARPMSQAETFGWLRDFHAGASGGPPAPSGRPRATRICLDLWGPRLLNPVRFFEGRRESRMDDQNRNLILATALSFLVILGWFLLFPPPPPEPVDAADRAGRRRGRRRRRRAWPGRHGRAARRRGRSGRRPRRGAGAHRPASRSRTDRLARLDLAGRRPDRRPRPARLFRDRRARTRPTVTLFNPAGSPDAYYALYGWAAGRRPAARTRCPGRPRPGASRAARC